MVIGFGKLFGDSFNEYSAKFKSIFRTYLVLYLIPAIIIGSLFAIMIFGTFNVYNISNMDELFIQNVFTSVALIILFFCLIIVFLVFYLLLMVAFIHIALSKKNDISLREAFGVAKKNFWRYLGFMIVTGVFLVLLYILLIIPGIIFTVYWAFASYIFIHKNTTVMGALKESKRIVRGNWWKVFWRGLLLLIIYVVVDGILGFIPIIGGLLSMLILYPFMVLFFKNLYMDMAGKKSKQFFIQQSQCFIFSPRKKKGKTMSLTQHGIITAMNVMTSAMIKNIGLNAAENARR